MAETLYAPAGILNPIIKQAGITQDDYEEVRLSVGGDTAIVGDLVSYDGQITVATPATHRDVNLAAAVVPDAQVTNKLQGWCGQIIEPVLVPNPVNGVAWDPSVALLDGTLVKILKRGAKATTAMIAVDTAAHDHLPGEHMCQATSGIIKPVVNTYTDTTPTTPELAAIQVQMGSEYVGRISQVSEDISNESVVFVDWGR